MFGDIASLILVRNVSSPKRLFKLMKLDGFFLVVTLRRGDAVATLERSVENCENSTRINRTLSRYQVSDITWPRRSDRRIYKNTSSACLWNRATVTVSRVSGHFIVVLALCEARTDSHLQLNMSASIPQHCRRGSENVEMRTLLRTCPPFLYPMGRFAPSRISKFALSHTEKLWCKMLSTSFGYASPVRVTRGNHEQIVLLDQPSCKVLSKLFCRCSVRGSGVSLATRRSHLSEEAENDTGRPGRFLQPARRSCELHKTSSAPMEPVAMTGHGQHPRTTEQQFNPPKSRMANLLRLQRLIIDSSTHPWCWDETISQLPPEACGYRSLCDFFKNYNQC